MAVKIGTATDHLDFWDILLDFLQNDPALVAANQNWDVAWQHPTDPEIVLRGPGLSGDDQALVGLRRRDDALTFGESVIDLTGMTGVIPSAQSFNEHVSNLPIPPLFFLDQNPMQYWIVANGRRFVVVLRISTIYQAGYAGLYLPYASPTANPMPLFIGGVRGATAGANAAAVDSWRWAATGRYRHFVYPVGNNGANPGFSSSACMLSPSGEWMEAGITVSMDAGRELPYVRMGPRSFPRQMAGSLAGPVNTGIASSGSSYTSGLGYADIRERLIAGLNGEYALTPITLNRGAYEGGGLPVTYGVLDGCFSVPGIGNAAENIISLNGVDHLVVANVQRTTVNEYWALALE